MYALYIILMYFNRSIEAWIVPKFPSLSHDRQTLGEIKLHNMNHDDFATNNNELSDVDVDADDASKFRIYYYYLSRHKVGTVHSISLIGFTKWKR